MIRGDINEYVGKDKLDYDEYEGHGFGERNEIGEKVLDFASAYELEIVNTFI